MMSTFDELLLTIHKYDFDIVAMSERLLDHVNIPGYDLFFNNREKIKGGGVGCYAKSSLKVKRKKSFEELDPEIEQLWLEIPGRNKHSCMLMGVLYRSTKFLTTTEWHHHFEALLHNLKSSWDKPLLIAGDMNLDILKQDNIYVKKYKDILNQFNLKQIVNKATRTTNHSKSAIDHIIVSHPELIKDIDVLPYSMISDHDGPNDHMSL